MPSRFTSALVGVVVALTACTPSQVDPDAEVSIAGVAADSGGVPLAGTRVGLTVDPGPGVLFWTPFILATLGAACLTDLCGADHQTTTGDDGSYRFDLRGNDVQGVFGEEVDVLLSFAGEARSGAVAGAGARATFVVRNENTVLPNLELWEPTPSLSGPGTIGWTPPVATFGVPDRYDALFQTGKAATIWSQVGTPEGATIDPRVLEDAQGAVAGVGRIPVHAPEGLREVALRSPSLAFRSRAGAPASRGADCAATTSDGSRVPLAPCRATDGVLTEGVDPRIGCDPQAQEPCPHVTGLEVQLGTERTVELIVVRGCEDCALDVSDAAPIQLTDVFAAVPLDGVTTDTITVRGGLGTLTEVSVWDGPTAGGLEQLEELPDTERAEGVAADPDLDEDERVPVWLAMLAAGLLGAAVATLILSARRRPRAS